MTITSFDIRDWYWIVGDTNPTTKVYSTASNTTVVNNATAFLTWLTNGATYNYFGSFFGVAAAADNGSGKLRATVQDNSLLQTGQYFNFAGFDGTPLGNGNQQITVVNGTTIDLTAVSFVGSAVATTAHMQGATIIDTFGHLAQVVNVAAIVAAVPAVTTFSTAGTSIVLGNPLASRVSIVPSASAGVFLPLMNAPNSIAIGDGIEIRNDGTESFVLDNINGTALITIGPDRAVDLTLTDNSTDAGSFLITTKTTNVFSYLTGSISGMRAANNTTTPNTKMDVTCRSVICPRNGGEPFVGMFPSQTNKITIDTGLSGPAVNGRDQSAAFSASQFLHFWAIAKESDAGGSAWQGLVSLQGPNSKPTLPTGYLFFTYLFSSYFDGSSHLVPVHAQGNLVTYDSVQNVLSAGTATGATPTTAVSFTTVVPSVADNIQVQIGVNDTGTAGTQTMIGIASGSAILQPTAGTSSWTYTGATLPNVAQTLYYNNSTSGGRTYIDVVGFTVPNGS